MQRRFLMMDSLGPMGARRACRAGALLLALAACGGDSPADPGDPDRGTVSVTTTTAPDGDVGLPYSLTLGASGGDGSYTWRLRAGEMPAGLTFDEAAGRITGTPTWPQTSTFTVEASDGSGAAPGTRQLELVVHSAPEIVSVGPAGAVVGEVYEHSLTADGGRGGYTWSITSGTLPPGLSLDSGGSIGGTATQQGRWTFTLRLTSGPAIVDQEVTIAVCSGAPTGDPWAGVEPWRGYQRDDAHTGYVPITLEVCRFAHAWTTRVGQAVRSASRQYYSQVVTEDGVALVRASEFGSTTEMEVKGLSLADGSELWREHMRWPSMPGIGDGIAYVFHGTHDNAEVLAVNAADGSPVFRVPFQAQLTVYRAPVITEDFVVAPGTRYGGINVFDRLTGDSIWARGLGGAAWYGWTPAVMDSMVATVGEGFMVLDLATGEVLESSDGCSCSGSDKTPVFTAPDRLAAIVSAGLWSYDITRDSIIWRRDPVVRRREAIAVAHGYVYNVDGDVLEVVDAATGALVDSWRPADVAGHFGERIIVTDNLLFTAYDGQVHVVDLATWEEVWHYPEEGELSLSEGLLLIQTDDGRVVAIETS